MEKTAVTIVPLESPHLAEAVSVIAEAFVDEPGTVHVIRRTPEKRLRVLQEHFRTQLAIIFPHGACKCALLDGEVAGVMVISPPGKSSLTTCDLLRFLFRMIFHTTPAMMWRGLGSSVEDESNRPEEPNYCLETIAVDPRFQGRGIGGAMLSCLTEVADGEGVLTYLSTTDPKTISFYERYGFQVISRTDSSGIPNYHLVRSPHGST
jgi:ribosomal protein S18 acetylase RimI-like enzyme